MPKMYVYVGMMTEVMKVQFPHPIKRMVPFLVEDIFDDLFADDPIYVEVQPDQAQEIQAQLDDAKADVGAYFAAKDDISASLEPIRIEKGAKVTAARIAYQQANPIQEIDTKEG